jgi:hypothetical protein
MIFILLSVFGFKKLGSKDIPKKITGIDNIKSIALFCLWDKLPGYFRHKVKIHTLPMHQIKKVIIILFFIKTIFLTF